MASNCQYNNTNSINSITNDYDEFYALVNSIRKEIHDGIKSKGIDFTYSTLRTNMVKIFQKYEILLKQIGSRNGFLKNDSCDTLAKRKPLSVINDDFISDGNISYNIPNVIFERNDDFYALYNKDVAACLSGGDVFVGIFMYKDAISIGTFDKDNKLSYGFIFSNDSIMFKVDENLKILFKKGNLFLDGNPTKKFDDIITSLEQKKGKLKI